MARLALVAALVTAVITAGCAPDDGDQSGDEPKSQRDRQGAGSSPTVIDSVEVGRGPLSLAVTPDGRHAYTANEGDISVVDLERNEVVTTIPFSEGAKEIQFSPDGRVAYVASGFVGGAVSIIDTAKQKVTGRVAVDGGPLYSLAVSPDGRQVYTANRGGGVAVIDVKSQEVKTRTPLPDADRGDVVLSRDGRHAYIANSAFGAGGTASKTGNTVSVFDTTDNNASASIPVDREVPLEMAITPDGCCIYVTHFPSTPPPTEFPEDLSDPSAEQDVSNALSVIDIATNKVSTIPVKGRSTGVAMVPDGRRVYVANESGTVEVIDTKTGDVVTTFRVGDDVGGIAMAPDGRHAYVTESERNKLHVIELGT